jgi:galactokinase
VETTSDRVRALSGAFRRHFGDDPSDVRRAPGRLNLIGEHTDYNGGLALPCAIHLDTLVVFRARQDRRVRVWSVDLDEAGEFGLESLRREGDWLDYVKGPAHGLGQRQQLRGLDLAIASTVPIGAGLSSSAALGVAVGLALDATSQLGVSPLALARAVQRGENDLVGIPSGLLDMAASALCREGHALRIDFDADTFEPVPLGGEVAFVVAHSGVSRALADGGYAERVRECGEALRAAKAAGIAAPEATSLRALAPQTLPALEKALAETPFRRARHVLTENLRVEAFADALARGDASEAGRILRAGHASLRDDYEVSVPELDALCELGDGAPGCFGSRMVGAGWGGCTLHLVDAGAAEGVARELERRFALRFGRVPDTWVARPGPGAGRVPDGEAALSPAAS